MPQRRGVALLLVVVAMGTAAVMTTAYLLSKDNSAAIGANAQDAAESAWVARSGADLALAILQTEEDWVDAEPEKLLEGFAIAGGSVSVVLTDLQGDPPDGTETELAMTIVADANGVKTVVQRMVTVAPDIEFDAAVDPELGEFGVYAIGELKLDSNARLGPWPASPEAKSGAANNLGAGFSNASDLTVDPTTELASTKLYVRPDAHSTLKGLTGDDVFVGGEALQTVVPVIPARLPAALENIISFTVDEANEYATHGYFYGDNLVIDSAANSMTLYGGTHFELLADNPGTVVTLDATADGEHFHFVALDIQDGAQLLIKGHAVIRTFENISLTNGGSIVLDNSVESSLTVYTGKNMIVRDSAIGVSADIATDALRSVFDLPYSDPARVRFYGLTIDDGGYSNSYYMLDDNSIMCGSVHAPTVDVMVNNSALCGRATVDAFYCLNGGVFLYDPAFNNHAGFTSKNGPLYDNSGILIDGLDTALTNYDKTSGLDGFQAYLGGSMSVTKEIDSTPIGDPTPRYDDRAIEKPWPFVAKAIEEGGWVSGDNEARQDDLYVALDPDIFDLDQFYDDGVIIATYTNKGAQDLDEGAQEISEDPIVIGGN
jgi:hypothetical protein